MGELTTNIWARVVENLGVSGLLIFTVWKIVDKWAARFLEVQDRQAKAMCDLAQAVKDTTGDQREILLAVRVLAQKVEEQQGWIKEALRNVRMGGTEQQ